MVARRDHGKMAGDMKRFSVLGDSISTFEGCNPEGFDVFYENERRDATGVRLVEDTWWAQVIEQCGGELLSNGSFSGSMVEGAGFPAANSAERIAALAKDGVAPDEILVFIGINDYGWGGPAAQAAGRGNALPATLDLSAIPEAEAGLASADAAERFGQAYSAMLARMRAAYPQAKVWCCTLCPGRIEGSVHSTFAYRLRGVHFDRYNDAIRLAAESNGCCVADVRALGRDYEALEGTHPTKRGMAQFALMVLHAMAACDGGSLEGHASNPLVDDAFGSAPRSLETCRKPACVGCAYAGATGNKWLCVCRKDDEARSE
ncbi:SGNH/GDSL hydrolase family protein [Paraeggerthella hominis]|uniref:SGNH/GDSL hydrolase family protein n=1 Tax=Paraeggerthella hominis TaxID=2897351 RepID=UPI001E2AD0A3|nr:MULTISPECIES: SGNH/GDSL hydrolase family protein [Paraeggerthella]MCD2432527.1 SGNH/GDSL hydrolase family protein [Paraeggerthella hominis]